VVEGRGGRTAPNLGRRRMTTSAGVATKAAMSYHPWQFLLVALAGWINRHQQDVTGLGFRVAASVPPKVP